MEERTQQGCSMDWLPVPIEHIDRFRDIAVEATEKGSKNPLWVIRARFEGDLLPGQLDVNSYVATVPYGGKSHIVTDFTVGCRLPDTIRWVNGNDGFVPTNAIIGGKVKCTDELLYVGRGEHEGQKIPGKIQVTHKVLYISYKDAEVKLGQYEVLCLRGGCQ